MRRKRGVKNIILALSLAFVPPAFAETPPRTGRQAAEAYFRTDAALYPRPPARMTKKKKPKAKAKTHVQAKPKKKPVKEKVIVRKIKIPASTGQLARAELPSGPRAPANDGLKIKLKKSKAAKKTK